ncbi:hypothetical protein BD408DRAFT_95989 [Parasitella parasitica]|nr:hypothetical protein BD408DRAFT_95989 [Parasitella parasitica]
MANLLDQMSEDGLHITNTLTNGSIGWPLDAQHNGDDDTRPPLSSHHMQVNVTAADDKSCFYAPTNKLNSYNYNNQNSHQRHPSPFLYNFSLNYYFNKAAITATSTTTVTATSSFHDNDCFIDFPAQMTKNVNHQKQFDPHIDEFDIVRAKVTGITRAMQRYHVDELEQEPLLSPIPFSIHTCSVDQLDNASTRPLSPLSILCPTTNSLVQSRAMEEQQDVVHNLEDEQKWHEEFLSLMSRLITYSENLESISTELLRTEGKVRELVLLQKTMLEEYEEREKLYQRRLDECEQVAQQQQYLMDHLVELDRDLHVTAKDRKTSNSSKNSRCMTLSATTSTTSTTATTVSTVYRWQSSEQGQPSRNRRKANDNYSSSASTSNRYQRPRQQQWDFNRPIGDIVQISSMEDFVSMLRWEVGLWVGGGVGTGHVIHSFESPLNGIELIIAGSGTIATAPADVILSTSAPSPRIPPSPLSSGSSEMYRQQKSFTYSLSIEHLRFHRHHYMLHISRHDRNTRFKLIPQSQWIPDHQATQCQFKTAHTPCSTRFHFFKRRHHCRRFMWYHCLSKT